MPVQHVEVGPGGARLGYVALDGPGSPLVYLHGLGASSPAYFARTATSPVLANRSALLMDFLGFGISDRPTDFGYTLEDHADSIARGLDALGLAGLDVVAHSMGGSIALVLATRRPDLVTRLVLAEPNLGPTARPRVQPYTESAFVEHGFAQALTAVGPDWAATMRLADPIALYRSETALGRGTTPQLDRLLADLPVACALIEGEHTDEPVTDPAIAERGVPLFTVPNAGHAMMLDNAMGFAQAIADALGSLGAPAPYSSGA